MTRMLRPNAEKLLAPVPEGHAFWCCDGRVLRDMTELGKAFDTMTDEAFAYHSKGEKKDFSNWVRNIIGDEELGRDLESSPNRTQAAETVAERVALLSSQLAEEKGTRQQHGPGRKDPVKSKKKPRKT